MIYFGIIISICSLALSLYTYFKHDSKIKKQSARLNKYQLEKIEKEKESEQKAILESNVIKGDRGKRIVKVYNKGKSIAKNVIVTFPNEEGFTVTNNPSPIDIRPQQGIDILLFMYESPFNKTDIEITWSDNFKESNLDRQTVQI